MADLEDLLVKTSRTFALSIPQLEGATRDQVTLGYLLLRIADTLEDAAVWSREQRVEALFRFADLLNDPNETVGGAAVQTAADVGAPVSAMDDDGDTLAYTLEGEADLAQRPLHRLWAVRTLRE